MLLKVKMSRLQARVNILLLVCVNQPVSVRRADCMRALLCVNHKCLHARALLPECMRGYSCFVCLPDSPQTRCDQLRSWQCPTRRIAPRPAVQVLRTKTQTTAYTPISDRRRQSETRNRSPRLLVPQTLLLLCLPPRQFAHAWPFGLDLEFLRRADLLKVCKIVVPHLE